MDAVGGLGLGRLALMYVVRRYAKRRVLALSSRDVRVACLRLKGSVGRRVAFGPISGGLWSVGKRRSFDYRGVDAVHRGRGRLMIRLGVVWTLGVFLTV